MRYTLLLAVTAIVATADLSHGQAFQTPALPGSTQYDGWGYFNSTTFPGYGGYPGTSPWSTPIGSNLADSADAALNKVSGSGYPSTSSSQSYIYSTGSGANAANSSPSFVAGIFSVTDTTPVLNLETVVFQIQISYWTNVGTPFPTGSMPTLTLNGGGSPLAASIEKLRFSGEFESEFGSGTSDWWIFQWDLRDVETEITSFQVNYSVTNHAQVYALQLDQGDVFTPVPEPHEYALGVAGLLLAVVAFRRRRAAA